MLLKYLYSLLLISRSVVVSRETLIDKIIIFIDFLYKMNIIGGVEEGFYE